MAFRVLHNKAFKKMGLEEQPLNLRYRACLDVTFVFFIQVTLLYLLGRVVNVSTCVCPPTMIVLATRFLCAILMHLLLEKDKRHG
jgi:hypothetical protein